MRQQEMQLQQQEKDQSWCHTQQWDLFWVVAEIA